MLLYEPIGGAGNNIYNSPPGQESPYKETSPLVTGPSESTSLRYGSNNSLHQESQALLTQRQQQQSSSYTNDLESLQKPKQTKLSQFVENVRSLNKETVLEECVKKPIGYLPAVFLGTLLNILDALSYGMIMFPIGETVFSSMGASGLSMFYVSTVISQLVYSLGASAFKSAIGSEMIEVTPFFHQMAIRIMLKLGEDQKDVILSTTVVTFAVSSVVTGICFLILGKCKLGKLVGFFPRHILVGCIGGVGYFLVVTGIEVSSRIQGDHH
ncbi:unnamed protein product [Ambrosiozyma monospora]|uniref:Unnamed protein product n=1 Tax=Ambrosiozyma monospora TaxID=43982 RepID=A0ACB5UB95_AMBMO|nr:unnamed protein product [Ambrosiozyma monospora]